MRKNKHKYSITKHCQVAVLFGAIFFFIACGSSESDGRVYSIIEDIKLPPKTPEKGKINYPAFDGNYSTSFNDLHDLHVVEAEKSGFSPMSTRRDTARMKGKVIYYSPGLHDNFIIDTLRHSIPVMIPEVAKLIEEIGQNFRDSLKTMDCPDCRIVVTSITRTDEDIKQLKRRNGNAINESVHRFGTSFDISWIRFHQIDTLDTRVAYDRYLKKALGRVLYRLQQEQRCYVKYETQQMCFHITVRKNG